MVNLDKKKYVASDWDKKATVSAKFWEWGANAEGVLPLFLMRQSDEGGGGDIDTANFPNAGRWAGDRVVLVGDYDESGLYQKVDSKDWKNIWPAIHNEFQRFYWGFIKGKPDVLKDAIVPSLEPRAPRKSAVVKTHTRKTKKGRTAVRGHIRRR